MLPETAWDVAAWYGQSLDNKPYIAVNENNQVIITDPEGYRAIVFSDSGEFQYFWGDFGEGLDTFSMPAGVAVSEDAGVWISDAGNDRLMHFKIPASTE